MKISITKYAEALTESLKKEKDKKEIGRKIQNLLKILVKRKQGKQIKRFEKEFKVIWLEAKGQMEVKATLPYELSDHEKLTLVKLLGEVLKKEIILDVKVDKEIIGGMKLEFDDCVIDATVIKNLEILKNSLITTN